MKQVLAILIVILPFISFSQTEDVQIRATLWPLGVSGEFGLSEKFTIDANAGLAPSYIPNVDLFGTDTGSGRFFKLQPNVAGGLRYYYNFEKRNQKEKKTTGNSANYLALTANYLEQIGSTSASGVEEEIALLTIGPVWGLQRTYNSGIYLDFNLGIGFLENRDVNFDQNIDINPETESQLGPVWNFKLGYAIFK